MGMATDPHDIAGSPAMDDGKARRAGRGEFATRVVIAIALVAFALLLWKLQHVLLLIFAAILVAVILHAAGDGLRRIVPLPGGLAMAVAGLLIVGLLVGAGILFGRQVGAQLSALSDALPGAWSRFVAWAGEGRVQTALKSIAPDGSTMASIMQTVLSAVSSAASGLMLAILGGIYLAVDPGKYRRGLLAVLPAGARGAADDATKETGKALRNWLLGQLVSMATTFAAVFIGLSVIGVPSALALAIVAGLFEFIPLVGPFLGAVPACLMALTLGVDSFAWTVGFFAVWQQIEGNGLAPLVMRYAVSIPPAVTLFALFVAGALFGIVGIVLGGPLTVAAWVMVKRLWVDPRGDPQGDS